MMRAAIDSMKNTDAIVLRKENIFYEANDKKFTLLTLLITMIGSTICGAKELRISKSHVDSNTFSYITNGVKDSTTTTAAFKLTAIYKADGTSSDYKRIYARVNSDGTEYSVGLGDWYEMTIPAGSRAKGSRVYLYCKGNNPSLDCKIDGYFNIH